MKRLWREPLLHFLLLGAGLFLFYGSLNRNAAESNPRTIVVDRAQLLTYLQFRARAFQAQHFNDLLDRLSAQELQRFIDDYVREEALYREARALQLDRNDYVARLRLIQQLEFITRGFVEEAVSLSESDIQRYFDDHRDDYYEPPKVTFTLGERHGVAQMQALAQAKLLEPNQEGVRFEQAPGNGDRFLYHVNYVGREPEEVASHFGEEMQRAVFALEPSDTTWRGPFESPYGLHLVLLTRHEPGYVSPLEEVRARAEWDARQAVLNARFEEAIQIIVDTYDVRVKVDEGGRPVRF